ncbi:hypothetical protein GCM10009775_18450 [Microbacterium aoyamense]|uniref:Glycosyltransferase 2-like domain-containing protein n=1 Tax=Microbacterium aoyamense TaxID=344166 RepID=A0ABN2PN80_9MICO|nr:glycosyltransferase family A protein [Microbacterium aoyamense]
MSDPAVDVVIPVHDLSRPVARAVGSVVLSTGADVRVSVVAHGLEPGDVEGALGSLAARPDVRVLGFADGIPSPAGPFNAGLDAATARFTSVMGSDDTLAPGAIDSWLRRAERDRADVVISRLRHAAGAAVPTPPTRPRSRAALDPVRDRLSYRSAPLGLVSRARFGGLRFAAGIPVGEDLPYVTRLWFSGAGISYDRTGPAYLIHDDAAGRTTFAPRPLAETFAFLPAVLDDPWFGELPTASRQSVIVKFIRIHLFGAITQRLDPAAWTPSERTTLRATAVAMLAAGEGIERVLSRRDRDLLDAALDPSIPAERLIRAATLRRQFAHLGSLVPRSLSRLLHREGPVRFAAASALQMS